jgi:hypothetical protein
MRRTKTISILFGLVFCVGCYRYVPAEMGAVPPGADVRAQLTGDGIEAMRGTFGPGVTEVEGGLASWDESGIGVMTETFIQRAGFPATNMTETIQLLPHHVSLVEIRELDGKRTAGFSIAVLGAMAGALWAGQTFGGGSDNNEGDGGGPDPDAAIIFKIPIRFGFR